jgi:hypothetical protein
MEPVFRPARGIRRPRDILLPIPGVSAATVSPPPFSRVWVCVCVCRPRGVPLFATVVHAVWCGTSHESWCKHLSSHSLLTLQTEMGQMEDARVGDAQGRISARAAATALELETPLAEPSSPPSLASMDGNDDIHAVVVVESAGECIVLVGGSRRWTAGGTHPHANPPCPLAGTADQNLATVSARCGASCVWHSNSCVGV